MKERKLKKQGFIKSVAILLLSQIFVKILGLIYRMYITNREGFGDKGNAIYSSGFQIYALLLTVSSIGVPNALSKMVSERIALGDSKGAHRIFRIAIATFGTIGFLCSILLFMGSKVIANNWLQIPEAEMSLKALAPSIFFVSLISVIKGYFNGRECIKVTAHAQSIEQTFKTVLTIIIIEIVAVVTGMDTSIMAAGANLATTLSAILCFSYLYIYYIGVRKEVAKEVKNTCNFKYNTIGETIKRIFKVSIPMSLTPLLGTINKNIDSITIVRGLKNFLTESTAKAQYGILSGKVDTLVTLPMSFNTAFVTALVPSLSGTIAKGKNYEAKKRIEYSILITILIGLPCMAGMILFATPILKLLFPNQLSGDFILQVSATSIIFIVLEQTISGILQGIGKTIIPAISLSVGVIAKLILNLVLVQINPDFFILGGTAGAAFSTTICHLIACSIDFIMLKKYIKLDIKINQYIIKPILATGIMSITAIFSYQYMLPIFSNTIALIASILLSFIIYVLAIIILKIFSKK